MRESRREFLIDAACHVLGKRGLNSLTLDAVAAEAGVSKGGILYHFASKDDLFEAMLQEMIKQRDSGIAAFLEQEPPGVPGRFLRAYIRSCTIELSEEEARMGSAVVATIAADPSWSRIYWPAVERWRARIYDDGIAPALALALMTAADGFSLAGSLATGEPRKDLRQAAAQRLLDLTYPAGTKELASPKDRSTTRRGPRRPKKGRVGLSQ